MLTCVHVCSGEATGTGFTTFHLPPPLNTVSLGICMDLNVQPPAVWDDLDGGPYELAAYCAARRTRVLVLNAPHNPTGGVIASAALAALGELARRHDLLVVADDAPGRATCS